MNGLGDMLAGTLLTSKNPVCTSRGSFDRAGDGEETVMTMVLFVRVSSWPF
jgi:hypothetical protein